MSRLLCLTELLRRLARPRARRLTGGPPERRERTQLTPKARTCSRKRPDLRFGWAGATIPHHNETVRRAGRRPPYARNLHVWGNVFLRALSQLYGPATLPSRGRRASRGAEISLSLRFRSRHACSEPEARR